MKDLVLKNISKAFIALGDMADTYDIIRKSDVYDPTTSNLTTFDKCITVKGFIESDVGEYIDRAVYPEFDLVMLIQGQIEPPEPGDTVKVSTIQYTIVQVINTMVGDTSAIHQILLKR